MDDGLNNKISVLNDGYVVLQDVMGDDLTVVNAARCSYDRKSNEMSDKDERLLRFLAREQHTSPFRHAFIQFEIKAPLMMVRQHFKYLTGSSFQEATGDNMTAWNEESRRYVRDEPSFYIPKGNEWRSKPENSKQGSGKPISNSLGSSYTDDLINHINEGVSLYEDAIENGVAPEQARLFLPAYGMNVRYYWSASLQSVAHFVKQREASDSQFEIQEYAHAIRELAEKEFPISMRELLK